MDVKAIRERILVLTPEHLPFLQQDDMRHKPPLMRGQQYFGLGGLRIRWMNGQRLIAVRDQVNQDVGDALVPSIHHQRLCRHRCLEQWLKTADFQHLNLWRLAVEKEAALQMPPNSVFVCRCRGTAQRSTGQQECLNWQRFASHWENGE